MQEADDLKETPQRKKYDYLRGQAAPRNRANRLHQRSDHQDAGFSEVNLRAQQN